LITLVNGKITSIEIKPIKTKADYQAALAEIDRLFDAKRGTLAGDRLDVLATLANDVDRTACDRKALKTFVRADGSLKAFPVQEKKFQVLLRYVVDAFEPDKRYTEKQVNRILERYNEDTARLRRGLKRLIKLKPKQITRSCLRPIGLLVVCCRSQALKRERPRAALEYRADGTWRPWQPGSSRSRQSCNRLEPGRADRSHQS
jgi:hypothetical protein